MGVLGTFNAAVPMGETLRLGRKGTKKETTLKSLSHLRFLHADSCRLGLVACKNLGWDRDFKVVAFWVTFLPRRRVSPHGLSPARTRVRGTARSMQYVLVEIWVALMNLIFH